MSFGTESQTNPHKKRRLIWDLVAPNGQSGLSPDHEEQLIAEKRKLSLQLEMATDKKFRELYIGNLTQGQATPQLLRDFLLSICTKIPSYVEKYGEMLAKCGPVRDIKISADGLYAFVEVFTEELAVTLLQFQGIDFMNRSLRIGRPSGIYDPSNSPGPLDVSMLRDSGILPARAMAFGGNTASLQDKRQKQLYVGKLPAGAVTKEILIELFEPACKMMPDYDEAQGPPVVAVDLRSDGRYAFVEFQSEKLATSALAIFNGMEVLGKNLQVGRPGGYVDPITGMVTGENGLPPTMGEPRPRIIPALENGPPRPMMVMPPHHTMIRGPPPGMMPYPGMVGRPVMHPGMVPHPVIQQGMQVQGVMGPPPIPMRQGPPAMGMPHRNY